MNVAVEERKPQSFTPSHIPQEITEYFHSMGKMCGLVYAAAGNLGQQRAYGREVVLLDELPVPLQRIARSSFDNPKKYDGELRLGDCILVSQSKENHDFWQEQFDERRRQLEDDQSFIDSFNEPLEQAMRNAGVPVNQNPVHFQPITDSKFSDHVQGGKDLAAEIMAAEANRKK